MQNPRQNRQNSRPDPAATDADALRRALQPELAQVEPAHTGRPALVVLCGLPGTGKSYFAAKLAGRTPCLTLGSDRLRKILVPQPRYTRGEHRRVFVAAHRLLAELLAQGYRVIFDATNLTERARQPLYDIAATAGAQLLLVGFDAPEDVVRQRLNRRAAGLSEDSYSDADWQIYRRLSPGAEPIAGPHYRVDSSQDIGPVLEELAGLLSSETHNQR